MAQEKIGIGGDLIDEQSSEGGAALHLAANVDITRLLLEAGADVALCNDNDETPLDIAIERQSCAQVPVLLQFVHIDSTNRDTIHSHGSSLC